MHRCTWLGGARAQWERVAQARNSSKHGSKHASMHVGGVVGERGKGTESARTVGYAAVVALGVLCTAPTLHTEQMQQPGGVSSRLPAPPALEDNPACMALGWFV